MTNQAEPGSPPGHDLSAFDLSKRSPEQLAQSFARWKAQRKRPPQEEATRADEPASPSPTVENAAGSPSPGDKAVALKRGSAKRAMPVQYSTTFSALLEAGSEPTVQRAAWAPMALRPPPKRNGSPGRRLMAMSALAGAASVLALAGGALLELSDWRGPTEVQPAAAQIRPPEMPAAASIVAAATRAPAVPWKLRRTVDLALMKAVPDANSVQPVPERPTIQTASKAAPPIAAPSEPTPKMAAPETAQFVAKPFVPSAAPTPVAIPAAQGTAAIAAPPLAAAIRTGDPRPDALFQHGRDKSNGASGNGAVGNRVASDGKPAAASGSKAAVDAHSATARTATARNGAVPSGGSGDPRGEVSGGATVGSDVGGEVGGTAGGGDASAGSDASGGNTGDEGAADGGSPSSNAGGDAGSADTGGSDTGGSDTGGDVTGGDESSTPSDGADDSESGSSDAEDGDSSGIGDAIDGALGAVGDALGGAPGSGKGNPDSNDKDQR